MAGSLVVPMTVSAKVLKAPAKVPRLSGGLFNRDQTLEAGIHVHWALPDALTSGKVGSGENAGRVFFPGVPDLWLVLRLDPPPTAPLAQPKLTWRAWVVDSIAESATPLESWQPPEERDPAFINTVAGVLPHADSLGHKAHGARDQSQGTFDPLVSAYYPACRTRFGFLDDLSGLTLQGRVSYTVIGWYSLRDHDPLARASNRRGWLQHARLAYDATASSFSEQRASVPADGRAPASPAWADAPISMTTSAPPTRAVTEHARRMAARGGAIVELQEKVAANAASFPKPFSAGGPVHQTVTTLVHDSGPKDILCHGTVLEVPLAGSDTVGAPIAPEDVRLYPSVKRAMADVVAAQGSAEAAEYVEMLLQNLDAKKGSVAGILDLPGAAHALTFQSVPGLGRFYARVDVHPKTTGKPAPAFAVTDSPFVQNRPGSAHWPKMPRTTASITLGPSVDHVPVSLLAEPKQPVSTGEPEALTPEQKAWLEKVRGAFDAAAAAAAAAGTPIHPRLVRVTDHRRNARSAPLGASRDGTGTDGSGWWLDIGTAEAPLDDALIELLKVVSGAKVHLPDAKNLFEQPGPRWYRPWSPQVVLHGTKRSMKWGAGRRGGGDGFLSTRTSGEAAAGLVVGGLPPVFAQDVIADPHKLGAAGLPPEARSLFAEAAMLDPGSAGVLARLALPQRPTPAALEAARRQFVTAARGLLLRRAPEMAAEHGELLAQKVLPFGELGGADGTLIWNDPRDPLLLDTSYAHPRSSLESDWHLEEEHVECTPLTPAATVPATGQVDVFGERTPVTDTIPKVLESAIASAKTLNMQGVLVDAQKPPEGLEANTFRTLDVISAPLRALDDAIFELGRRERTGALRLNRVELVDMFGQVRPWTPSPKPADAAPDGNPAWPHWTPLSPRLPYWSRLHFRLQSEADPNEEASPIAPPICGLLLPDFIEHALEVFDGSGRAIGQLTSDRARFGDPGTHLQVHFTVHPWVAAAKGIPDGGDPLEAIENPTLHDFVASVIEQGFTIPASQAPNVFAESGLTALLRVIDTVRSTLDPSVTVPDKRVRLLGEPIAVMVARLSFEASHAEPSALAHGTPLLPTPPALPEIAVRIGDVTRPDDGVIGAFIRGATDAAGRFAPVSAEARSKAIFNGLAYNTIYELGKPLPIVHEFILPHEVKVTLTAGQAQDVVLLTDVRGGLFATSGVLPRKHLKLPKEFLDAALAQMEPTFRVGPVLTFARQGSLKVMVPPPSIDGHTGAFVHEDFEEDAASPEFVETPIPAMPPLADLPVNRVTLREGWVRVVKHEP